MGDKFTMSLTAEVWRAAVEVEKSVLTEERGAGGRLKEGKMCEITMPLTTQCRGRLWRSRSLYSQCLRKEVRVGI